MHRSDDFSARGEKPTDYERALLEHAASEVAIADVWVIIGKRIGADALAVVLDELGGEKPHVPRRETFFAKLAKPHRDARIRELSQHLSIHEIAKHVGLGPRAVYRKVNGR